MRRRVSLVIIVFIVCCGCVGYHEHSWAFGLGENGERDRSERVIGGEDIARSLEGRWSINADNSTGILELSRSGGRYIGRVYFDALRHWETLTNIRFDAVNGQIDFDRLEANQHYAGRLVNADMLEGTFSGGRQWGAKRN
jgi:hypothetical protein